MQEISHDIGLKNMEPILQPNPHRYVLFPIKYASVFEYYKKHVASFWTAEEISFQEDLVHFQKLCKTMRDRAACPAKLPLFVLTHPFDPPPPPPCPLSRFGCSSALAQFPRRSRTAATRRRAPASALRRYNNLPLTMACLHWLPRCCTIAACDACHR